jgi:hypothetical protein
VVSALRLAISWSRFVSRIGRDRPPCKIRGRNVYSQPDRGSDEGDLPGGPYDLVFLTCGQPTCIEILVATFVCVSVIGE